MLRHPRADGRTPRHRRGFALIDALVGGVVLGIGLTIMLSVTSRAMTSQSDGEHRLTASWLADELLTMVLVEGPDNYPKRHDTNGHFDAPFEAFDYDVAIEFVGRGLPYQVNAIVSWGSRSSETLRVETLIALRTGDPEQLREPYEPVDRFSRYYDDEQ